MSISVIIPAYNAEDTIEKCIMSVLQQTVNVLEIIVVDDGSVDNTITILTALKNKTNQIKIHVFSQANGGPAKARNLGIINAKGEWIAFLDADDRWLPQKISKQLEVLEKNSHYSIIGTTLYTKNKKHKGTYLKNVTFNKMLFQNSFFTSTVLVKKDIMSQFFFDEKKRYSEDYKLWLLIIKSFKGIIINEGLVIYAENQRRFKRKSLSNNLWEMEKNEIGSFIFLYNQKFINFFVLVPVILFSLLKFFKRFLLSIL